jgi:predicted 3-demethylubiquinone-9 3-methyltransferase (glyoxalase superfamily)
MAKLAKIVPSFWYARDAEKAAEFYVSIFPDSEVVRVTDMPAESPSGPPGSVKLVDFMLFGQSFFAMTAGPLDQFNHAISLSVMCENQTEIDKYYSALLRGGTEEQCGWVKDKFGVSWQVVPRALGEMMADMDRTRAKHVAEAMLRMKKLDIGVLEEAFRKSAAA